RLKVLMANRNTRKNTTKAAMPMGMITQVLAAAGREAENSRSVAPAEKLKPARKPRATVTAAKMPYSREYTTYRGNARNMKANSKGSVTPHRKADRAAAPTIPMVAFFLLLLAVRTIARAAPGIPNIMQGKKPAM